MTERRVSYNILGSVFEGVDLAGDKAIRERSQCVSQGVVGVGGDLRESRAEHTGINEELVEQDLGATVVGGFLETQSYGRASGTGQGGSYRG